MSGSLISCSPPWQPTIRASREPASPISSATPIACSLRRVRTPDQHRDMTREFISIVLKEQELSGLAMITDGDVAHEDRLHRLVEGLGGTSTSQSVALPDGASVQAPRFDRAPRWQEPITVDAWRWAVTRATSWSSRSSSDRTRSPASPSPAGPPARCWRWAWRRPSMPRPLRWQQPAARSSRSMRAR